MARIGRKPGIVAASVVGMIAAALFPYAADLTQAVISGMIMSAKALLERNPNPTEEEIRWGISGNLCRCTGYVKIVEAIQYAAAKLQAQPQEEVTV